MESVATSEIVRGEEAAGLARKIRRKFFLRAVAGELYVGKRMKMRYLGRVLPGVKVERAGRILEVGSEDGAFTDFIARRYPEARVEGLEVRAEWAAGCEAWARGAGREALHFRQGDVLGMTEVDAYHAIFCLDVLGYIREDRRAVANLARALTPGGVLVIHQPHVVYREYGGKEHHVTPEEAGKVTGGHVRHGYTVGEMRTLAEAAGLGVEKILRLHGKWSDVAHRVHRRLERPAMLRFVAAPIVDVLWWLDARGMKAEGIEHGNTVLGIFRKPGRDMGEGTE